MKKYLAKCRHWYLGLGPSSAQPDKKPLDNNPKTFAYQRTRNIKPPQQNQKNSKGYISVTPPNTSPRLAQINGATHLPTAERNLILNKYKNLVLYVCITTERNLILHEYKNLVPYECMNLVPHKRKRHAAGLIVGWETLKKTDQDGNSQEIKKRHVTVTTIQMTF